MARLNAGSGPVSLPGWVAVDRTPYPGGVVADLCALPFRDNAFECAHSNHVLQMLAWPDLVPSLAELRRVVVQDGWLRMFVPDLLRAVYAYLDNRVGWFPIADEIEEHADGKFCVYVSQAGSTRSVFTRGHLRELLHRAGWEHAYDSAFGVSRAVGVHPWLIQPFLTEPDSRADESLVMDAV